jgi:hypothetical protein
LIKQKAFDKNLAAIFGRKGRVEAANYETDECNRRVSVREVCMFHIFQGSIGDMEFEFLSQRFIGVIAIGVTVDK